MISNVYVRKNIYSFGPFYNKYCLGSEFFIEENVRECGLNCGCSAKIAITDKHIYGKE